MSLMGNLLGNKALASHGKGEYEKAIAQYDEGYKKGMDKLRMLKSYSTLLIRYGRFDDALEVLKKMERMPGITPKDKATMHMNYAIILWKKGHIDRALEILEDEFRRVKTGTMYSIIGFLKIEKGDAEDALAFNKAALEYDDEDPVLLDNLAQTYYRLLDDKQTAKEYFDKAIAIKEDAIDTNYFLALYDIEAGDIESARKRLRVAREKFSSPLNYASAERIDALLAELEGK